MLKILQRRFPSVVVFDRAKRKPTLPYVLGTLWLYVRFAGALLSNSPKMVYLPFSGGYGQALDFPFLLLARLIGIRVLFHHHSFAYINSHSRLTQLCLRLAPAARHIVLCECMGVKFANSYGIPQERIHSVSNAAFLDESSRAQVWAPNLRLGFISVLSREKGIFAAIEIFKRVQVRVPDAEMIVAGPLDSRSEVEFMREIERVPRLAYIGQVHGERKMQFLNSLTALVFPTAYKNEAEPLVVLEAMRSSIPVYTTARGCNSDRVGGGYVTAQDDNVVEALSRAIVGHFQSEMMRRHGAENGARFNELKVKSKSDLDALIERYWDFWPISS